LANGGKGQVCQVSLAGERNKEAWEKECSVFLAVKWQGSRICWQQDDTVMTIHMHIHNPCTSQF